MDDYSTMLMQGGESEPDGLDSDFWLAPNLPYVLKQRVEVIFEVLSHLPLEQPLAVVADAGKTVAVNAPLLRLLGGAEPSMVGQMWSRVMPAWPERSREFRREGEQVFEEHLVGAGDDSVWVRVSLGPIPPIHSAEPVRNAHRSGRSESQHTRSMMCPYNAHAGLSMRGDSGEATHTGVIYAHFPDRSGSYREPAITTRSSPLI